MTREEFIEALEEKGYSYREEGGKIVIDDYGNLWLSSLKTLPLGLEFKNGGDAGFGPLETLPPGTEFRNSGCVYLNSLKELPPGVVFNNRGIVHLISLETISPDVEFNNKMNVNLGSLTGGYFYEWEGNIKGIDSKRLLNKMIELGLFNRR